MKTNVEFVYVDLYRFYCEYILYTIWLFRVGVRGVHLLKYILTDSLCYIISVGFEPKATGHTSHHMLIYGCSEPGSDEPVW